MNAKSDIVHFLNPEAFNTGRGGEFFVSWFSEQKLVKRVVSKKMHKDGFNFTGKAAEGIGLYYEDNFLCQLKIIGTKVVVPEMKIVLIDVSSVKGGGVILSSADQNDGFYFDLIGKTVLEVPMAATEKPIEVSYKFLGKGGFVKVATFSIGEGKSYSIRMSDADKKFAIQVEHLLEQ